MPDMDNRWAAMAGLALNVEYTRKYGFDTRAAARMIAKLVAVPPPIVFQDALQAALARRREQALAPVAAPEG